MLYLYDGEDVFTSREAAAATRHGHADAALGDLGVRILDGATCSWDDVVQACSVLPFLATAQVVEIRGLLGAAATERRGGAAASRSAPRSEGGGDGKRVPPPAQVVAFFAGMPPSTVLILVEGALPPTNPYLKALQEAKLPGAELHHNQPLSQQAQTRWLQQRAQAEGVTLKPEAAGLLGAINKADLWAMHSDMAKLASYAGPGGTITRDAVEALVPAAAEATVFALADAIGQRRLAQALTLLHTLLDRGAAPEYIMAVLSGRVRDWLTGAGRGPRPAGLTPDLLADAFNALVGADRVLKTGSSDDRLVVMDVLVTILTERLPSTLLEDAFATGV